MQTPINASVEAISSCYLKNFDKISDDQLRTVLLSPLTLEEKLAKALSSSLNDKSLIAKAILWLIAQGADITARQHVALRWAAEYGQLALLSLLLTQGGDVHCMNDEPLIRAVLGGHHETVRILLAHGANVHAREDCALRMSCSLGFTKIVNLLLQHGADLSAKRYESVRKAFDGAHFEVLSLLLKHDTKKLLNDAEKREDWQIFAVTWQYAYKTKDMALQNTLKQYGYSPNWNCVD